MPRRSGYFLVKRLSDVVVAVLALVVLAPVLLLTAVAIAVTSPGPVLFRQQRMGSRRVSGDDRRSDVETWELTPFIIFKFRTMYANADESVHVEHSRMFTNGTLEQLDGTYKLAADPRITPLGRWLRRLSIDEFPQLLNVVRGDMSLVGPRPVPLYEVAGYSDRDFQRFTARPGITGLWQISGRGTLGFREMVLLDVAYARRRSLLLDARIVLSTASAIIRAKGAG